MRVAFAGTPEFAVPALQALIASPHAVVGVLTRPDRPQGRGLAVVAGPVKAAALAAGVPIDQPASLRDARSRERLASWQPDVLVVVAYGLLLPSAVLQLPRLGCVNIHASLLPRWRGAAPIQRAVLAGDAVTGVSLMQMDEGLDTGPVLARDVTPIGPQDTSGSLHERLAGMGAALLVPTLEALEAGRVSPEPQPASGSTYAARLTKAEARIDWALPAPQIERQVRAFDPWPVAETSLDGEQLRVHKARLPGSALPPGGHPGAAPGTIVAVCAEAVRVRCGEGELELLSVQRPGRRVASAGVQALGGAWLGRRLG